jgi:hypothetical protein
MVPTVSQLFALVALVSSTSSLLFPNHHLNKR